VKTVGNHRLESLLGRGGMGEVWKARDEKLGRWVALKRLTLQDPEDARRFQREAQTAASLDHPGIAAIYEVGDGWIAMQLIDGGTLKPGPDAVRQVRDAAVAVGFAHGKGIVHRDLKPANIMVERDGRVFVMDFGLARSVRAASSLTVSGALLGTPAYMSPEQARGERATPASDVWSLGATLYEITAGRLPFVGADLVDVLMKIVSDDPAPLPGNLGALVRKCLEKDPARRYPHAGALAADLDRCLRGDPVAARPAGALDHLKRRVARHRGVVLASVLAAAAVAASLAAILPRLHRSETEIERRDRFKPLRDAIADARPYFYMRGAAVEGKLATVRSALQELERLEPKDAEAWTMLGMGWYFLDRPHEAEQALRHAEPLAPDDGRVAYYLARICIDRVVAIRVDDPLLPPTERQTMRSLLDAAVSHLQRPMKQGAVEPIDHDIAAAYRAFTRGDNPAKDAICRAGLARYGDALGTEEFWLLLSVGQTGQARVDSALRAVERRPHFPIAWFSLGIGRNELRDYEGAREAYTEAIRLKPDFGSAWANRASDCTYLGRFDDAIADYTEAIRLNPLDVQSRTNRGVVRMYNKQIDEAIEDHTEALRRCPEYVYALLNRGNAYHLKGRGPLALQDYDAALALDPNLPELYASRGQTKHWTGDFTGAVADYEEALRRAPADWRNRPKVESVLARARRRLK